MIENGQILVVDNHHGYLHAVAETLREEGYTVFTAENEQQAEAILERNNINLAVIDLRLADNNSEADESGLALADRMDPHIAKFIYTAYYDARKFRNRPENTWYLDKTQDPETLIGEVNRVFQDVLIHPLEIEETAGVSLEQFLLQVEDFQDLPDEQLHLLIPEFKELLSKLFQRATKIRVSFLQPGRSGAGVMLACPYYNEVEGTEVVVKFGLRQQIMHEVSLYRRYAEPFVRVKSTQLIGSVRRTRHLAGALFLFVGMADAHTHDFATAYRSGMLNSLTIPVVIENLFFDSCKLWYSAKRPWDLQKDIDTLAESYQKQLGLDQPEGWRKVQNGLAGLLGHWQGFVFEREAAGALTFRRPLNGPPQTLVDPVWFVENHADQLPEPHFWAITHGDLNSRNVFIDHKNTVWLIDFSRTGWGPALRDAAELEAAVKFELIGVSELGQRLLFEDVLTQATTFDDPLELPSQLAEAPPFLHARDAVRAIRYAAGKIAGTEDMSHYNTGLLFYALKVMPWQKHALDGVDYAVRQRHALYAAARLCEKILA